MTALDLIVGTISAVVGLTMLLGGMFNLEPVFRFAKLRWLSEQLGRGWARLVCVLLGVIFFALGIAIALGWRLQW
jgi:hypothetical protein